VAAPLGAVTGSAVSIPLGTPLAQAEDRLINETLALCGGDKEKAARMLGVSSRTLYRRAGK
jgi:DNA-binding NtrC family response regulator